MSRTIGFVLMLSLLLFSATKGNEDGQQFCTSTFDFEKKLLENMVRLEHTVSLLKEDVDKELTELTEKNEDITAIRDRVANEQVEFKALMKNEQAEFKALMKNEQAEFRTLIKNELTEFTARMRDEQTEFRERMKKEQDVFVAQTNTQLNDERKELEALQRNFTSDVYSKEMIVFSANEAKVELVDRIPVFQTILVNEGGAYDVTSGKFTCPLAGIYSFSFTTRSVNSSSTWCYIRLNTLAQGYAITEGVNNMASITVHLKLKVKDVVDIGDCANWGNTNQYGMSFLGSLLYKTEA